LKYFDVFGEDIEVLYRVSEVGVEEGLTGDSGGDCRVGINVYCVG